MLSINEANNPAHLVTSKADQASPGRQDSGKAAESFESFFIYYMLKVMRDTVPKSGFLGEGPGGDLYTSLLDEQIAQGIASRGGFGLSDMLLKEIEVVTARDSNSGSGMTAKTEDTVNGYKNVQAHQNDKASDPLSMMA